MNKNKFVKIALGLIALTSCTQVEKKVNNEKPTLVFYKPENTNLPDYTEEYTEKNFDIRGDYLYKGEQLNTQYIDSETVVYKTSVENVVKELYPGDADYDKYVEGNDKYTVTVTKVKDPKNPSAGINDLVDKKTVKYKEKTSVYVTLKSLDTGKETKILINKDIKVIDPLEVVKKHYPEVARDKDLKNGLDNNRISLDIISDGITKTKVKQGDLRYEKYEDLDDIIGEKEVLVRVRVDGFASERDKFITKKVFFGEKLEDYSKDYSVLFTDLSKNSLKYSEDGKEILGGFDKYLVDRLKENGEKLEFITRLSSDEKTVGKNRVVREIKKDGKIIYSKKDDTFVGLNGPTVLIADNSFFDLSPEVEKRTYRQTPYYSDPKFNYLSEIENAEDEYKEYYKLERTHGATVIGSMIDELSYGKSLFWKTHNLFLIGREGKKSTRSKDVTDEKLYEVTNATLELLLEEHKDKYKVKKFVSDVRVKMYTDLLPAFTGKSYDENGNETQLTEEQKKEKLNSYYTFLEEKSRELRNTTEEEKLKLTNLNFQTIAIGKKDGRGVDMNFSAKYISKALEDNKNIKVVNMSYGSDQSFDDYIALDNVTEEQLKKGTSHYNNSPLYRFLIQAWLKNEDGKIKDLISDRYPEAFDAMTMYKYLKNKETINEEDFARIIRYKKYNLENALKNSAEFIAANNDVIFVRALGNTYPNAPVDLLNYNIKDPLRKILFTDPNQKYNHSFGSTVSMINYLKQKEAIKEGKEFTYDYSYRKNIIGVVGVSNKGSISGRPSTDNFNGYGIGTVSMPALKNKNITPGMLDTYLELVKELNSIRKNPENYPIEYAKEVEEQIKAIEKFSSSNNGQEQKYSLTRAGSSKLWSLAAEGEYVYVADKGIDGSTLDEDKKFKINFGSSFATPRVSAVAAKVQEIYPWMSAHQIKQTVLTTALDDFRVLQDGSTLKVEGIYGVDENIGWGLLSRDRALKGPARFVKALTHETGDENFIANVKYGYSEFSNDIAGGFSVLEHMVSRGKLSEEDAKIINDTSTSANIDRGRALYEEKVKTYIASLPFEERELFLDAGLVKEGKGTLVLSGINTYKGDTDVREGTLVLRGGQTSDHYVSVGAKLKLDMNPEAKRGTKATENLGKLNGNVFNKGELYSYSDKDIIVKSYLPYKGSKTYISPISFLSISNLDLSETDNFTLDFFRNNGITASIIRDKKIFEAKAKESEVAAKVKLGIFPVSEMLSLSLEYSKGTLTGTLKKGGKNDEAIDKRPSGGGLSYLNELEERLKAEREKLDKEAEERAERIRQLLGNGNNSTTATPTRPGVRALSEAYILAENAILLSNKREMKEINGETLADSLTVAYDIEAVRLDNVKNLLKGEYLEKKLTLGLDLLSNLKVEKDVRNDLSLKSHQSGMALSVVSKIDKFKVGAQLDYLNGSVYNDNIQSVKLNSFGGAIFGNFERDNIEIGGLVSFTGINKTVVKNVLFEDRSESKQNQMTFTFNVIGGYNFNIKDKAKIKPYIGLENSTFIFNKYDVENSLLGMKYDLQAKSKVALAFGSDFNVKINDKLNFNGNLEYKRWLNSTVFDINASSSKYDDIKTIISSRKVAQNEFRALVGLDIKPIDKLEVKVNYQNKNLKDNKINVGLKYTF